jgi:transposase-like protein
MEKESWEQAIRESRPWTRAEAARAMAALKASGMTTAAFARHHGTTAGRVQYWQKRLREIGAGGESRLLPVRVVEAGQARLVERGAGRVVLVEGPLRVEMEGMSAEWVAGLIRLLRRESKG